MSRVTRCAIVLSCGLLPCAHASVNSEVVDNVQVTVYAPDWTWQKQQINILIVCENQAPEARTLSFELIFPYAKSDHFEFMGDAKATLRLEAGETIRHAFTDITALAGHPRQRYEFSIRVTNVDGAKDARIAYPVRTVRGAATSTSRGAAAIPAILAGLWCIVIAAYMLRVSAKNAWRAHGEAVHEPAEPELWIAKTP